MLRSLNSLLINNSKPFPSGEAFLFKSMPYKFSRWEKTYPSPGHHWLDSKGADVEIS